MSRPQRQRRDSHREVGFEFKSVNIVKTSNSSGHYFQLFRIDSMLLAATFYFFPAFRRLIPAHCLLCLFKTSGLAFLSSASGRLTVIDVDRRVIGTAANLLRYRFAAFADDRAAIYIAFGRFDLLLN